MLAYQYSEFQELLARLRNDSKGIELQSWQVPCSTFWLIDERREIVGVANLRHSLTQSLRKIGGHIGFGVRPSARRRGVGTILLAETLKKAAQLGIISVLVTCDKSNLGSASIIKKNGGVFQDEEYFASENDFVQRYWIDLQRRVV